MKGRDYAVALGGCTGALIWLGVQLAITAGVIYGIVKVVKWAWE